MPVVRYLPYLLFREKKMQDDETVKFGRLLTAAHRQDWLYVDQNIADGLTARGIVWATSKGLDVSNDHVRNLAAIILEKCDAALPVDVIHKAEVMVSDDPNRYVGFHLALALAARGSNSPIIRDGLLRARTDEDGGIAAAANTYLEQLAAA